MESAKADIVLSDGRRKRDSNFELLRIVAMMMVILQHIALYGGWPIVLEQAYGLDPNAFFIQFIYHFGKIGVWIFVLVTGYFMVGSKSPVVPKFLKLWLQVLLTSVIIDVFFVFFVGVSPDYVNWDADLTPFLSGNWWFATVYLIALPFMPFVNRLLSVLNRREHLTLIIITLVMWCVLPSFTYHGMYGSMVMMFLAMYLIGAYIRRFPSSFDRSAGFYGLLSLGAIVLLAVIILTINVIGLVPDVRPLDSAIVWGDERSLMVVLIATLVFLTFRKLNIGHRLWVNIVASTTFGVYLIHEHHFVRDWIFGNLDMGSHFNSPDLVPFTLLCMVGIFAMASVLEFVRIQTLERVTDRAIPVLSRVVYRAFDILTRDRPQRGRN